MLKSEAIDKIGAAYKKHGYPEFRDGNEAIADLLEALGLIKFDAPKPAERIAVVQAVGVSNYDLKARVPEDELLRAVASLGYVYWKSPNPYVNLANS
jgi:hypothetical protein